MAKRKYTESYRQEACGLVTREKYTVQDAARSLGIPKETLVGWLRRGGPADQRIGQHGDPTARDDAGAVDPKAMAIEIRELQAKIRRLEMEKEILKKATAYFANQQP